MILSGKRNKRAKVIDMTPLCLSEDEENDLAPGLSSKEAAQYLGITLAGLKYHVYESRRLKGHFWRGNLYFTPQELDTLKA